MDRQSIIAILQKHQAELHRQGVLHAALFGSVARGEARPDSDIDIMIDLDPDARLGVFDYVGLKDYIAGLFDATGLWDAIAADPFSRAEWLEAVRVAPSVKESFYTVLSSRDVLPEVDRILANDSRLMRCFQD